MKHFGKMILSAVLAAGLMALPVYADNGVVGPTGAAAAETVSAEVGTAPAAEGAAEAGKVTATSGTTGTARGQEQPAPLHRRSSRILCSAAVS